MKKRKGKKKNQKGKLEEDVGQKAKKEQGKTRNQIGKKEGWRKRYWIGLICD